MRAVRVGKGGDHHSPTQTQPAFPYISISSVLIKMKAAFRAKIVGLGKVNAISKDLT